MGENIRLCYGCMEPLGDDEVCQKCGYTNNDPYLPKYLAPGTVLNNRYIVGKLLHVNGEGATYIAYDGVLGKKSVIKEYMPDTLCERVKDSSVISVNQNNLAQYKTFMSEFTELNKVLSKMRTLNHINPAIDMFAENNTTYVVFEYLDGMSLEDFLKANGDKLSWEQIKKIFPPIFTTISLIHNEGIIHRGISPETIWVTETGELKLIGFCIETSRTANTELAPEMYSGYAAPEQYSSKNWQGTWTDVYAISAVLYRMLTGVMPIDALSRIGNDNLEGPVHVNKDIPKNISNVIMEGMKLTGENRIQTITELVTNLFEQPDYLDKNNASAVVKREVMSQEERDAKIKKENAKRNRIPIFVFLALLGSLLIAALIALTQITSDKKEDDNLNTGTSVITMMSGITSAETMVTEQAEITEEQEEIFVMPDFLGKNYELMKSSDTYKEWFVFEAENDYNDDYPKGEIYDQSIKPGSIITKGTKVKFKVSNGAKVATVPDYFGKKINDFIVELDNVGIKYDIQYEENSGFMNDYVTRLSKEAGETIDVEKGEVLIVYVCKNRDVVTEPEESKNPIIDYNDFDFESFVSKYEDDF